MMAEDDQYQNQQNQQKTSTKKKNEKLDLDMHMRDPHDLNSHLRTNFDEIIGEPDGAHSDECIWVNSYKAFLLGKTCCYTCLTYVCAIPLAFCWGCNFACLTFLHIWNVTPCFRVFRINCDCAAKFFSTIVHCWCDPCYEAVALMFTKIYVNIVTNADPFKEKTYSGLSELVIDRQVADHHGNKGNRGRMAHQYEQEVSDDNRT